VTDYPSAAAAAGFDYLHQYFWPPSVATSTGGAYQQRPSPSPPATATAGVKPTPSPRGRVRPARRMSADDKRAAHVRTPHTTAVCRQTPSRRARRRRSTAFSFAAAVVIVVVGVGVGCGC